MQSNDQPGWERLGRAVSEARTRVGFVKRARFARELDIDDSTLAIIEGARPGRVSEPMLNYVTVRLGWTENRWRSILSGDANPPQAAEPTGLQDATDAALIAELGRRLSERSQTVRNQSSE